MGEELGMLDNYYVSKNG